MRREVRLSKKKQAIEVLDRDTGSVVEKECYDCRQLKGAEEYPKYNGEHLRPYCKDCWRERQRAYYEGIKLKRTVYRHRARAREEGLADTLSEEQLKELFEHASGRCMLSNEPATEADPLTIDHVTAIGNSFSLGNAPCNIILVKRSLNLSRKSKCLLKYVDENQDKVDANKVEETLEYLAQKAGVSKAEFERFLADLEEYSQRELSLNG